VLVTPETRPNPPVTRPLHKCLDMDAPTELHAALSAALLALLYAAVGLLQSFRRRFDARKSHGSTAASVAQ